MYHAPLLCSPFPCLLPLEGRLLEGRAECQGRSTHTLFHIFAMMVYHRILNIVPCTVQEELVVYPSYK